MRAMFVQTTTARLSSMWAGSHDASLRVMTPPHQLSSGVRTQINGWSCYFADYFFPLYGQKPWRSSTKYISIFKAFNVFPQPVKADGRPLKSGTPPPRHWAHHTLSGGIRWFSLRLCKAPWDAFRSALALNEWKAALNAVMCVSLI